jgi:hypothetical protein
MMRTYSKIIGIILTIIAVVALVCIAILVFNQEYIEDKVIVSLLFLPCFVFLHFLYLHNFGFNLKDENPRNNYKIILILTIFSSIISVMVPGCIC